MITDRATHRIAPTFRIKPIAKQYLHGYSISYHKVNGGEANDNLA